MKPWILIGHRGAGKTSLLARLRARHASWKVFDLDEEIARRTYRSVSDIFEKDGERAFRELEQTYFDELWAELAGGAGVIALGAGFEGKLPAEARVVWVRRSTDARGRIFLDRPRLNVKVDPLAEFLERFPTREKRYAELATETLTLREGGEDAESPLSFFNEGYRNVGGVLTLLPENFCTSSAGSEFLRRRLNWGVGHFEIRDDLLGEAERAAALAQLPLDRVLWSYRTKRSRYVFPDDDILWDWALELGRCPHPYPPIVSAHERKQGESLSELLARLEAAGRPGTLLKAAPIVKNFAELQVGHRWWARDPEHRVFLPRTDTGEPRWAWYRLVQKGRFRFNFIREGAEGSAPDQPSLLEWIDAPAKSSAFAAVLGSPVQHSRTPCEHGEFFRARGMPCVAVPLSEDDWQRGALDVLREIGLTHAAVTSPLKKLAFELVTQSSGSSDAATAELGSVNTLAWDAAAKLWRGTSTDTEGLLATVREGEALGSTAVWGGGGVLPILMQVLDGAGFYAARTGKLQSGPATGGPDTVVWAARVGAPFPPPKWRPRQVLDLNYFENSPARAYARDVGARYVSGLSMFRAQAAAQRSFWSLP